MTMILTTGVTVGINFMQTPRYEASAEILVGQSSADEIPQNAYDLQQLTQTLAETVHTSRVAEEVIQELNLQTTPENILQNMRVEQVKSTQVIKIEYGDTNPQRAQEIADAVGKVFSKQLPEASLSANSITATVWEHAKTPDSPVSPQPIRNGAIALVVGAMLGIALALLLDYLTMSDAPRRAKDL